MRPEAILGSLNPSEIFTDCLAASQRSEIVCSVSQVSVSQVSEDQELVYPVRFFGGMRKPRIHVPANDNHPDRVTQFVINNGGCSTTSDFAAVSLARVPTLDKPEVPLSEMEKAA